MTRLEQLNSFFIERLMTAAREIFEVVKDTVSEYQGEIERTKQENSRLRKIVDEVNASASREKLTPDNQTRQVELPNFSQKPLASSSSVLQVKVELSTVHQDAEPQGPKNVPSSSPSAVTLCSKEAPHHFSRKPIKEEKLEPLDVQVICFDNASTGVPRVNITHLEDLRDDHSYCPSSVLLPSDVFSHAETHFQSQPAENVFCCKLCRKLFKSHRQLKQHLVVHQKDRPRPYRCDLCGNCYTSTQILENHHRTHTDERPYHCRFCERCFKQKGHLYDHEKIHTGEKPYSCSICGKRFVQSSQFKRHVRNHHQVN